RFASRSYRRKTFASSCRSASTNDRVVQTESLQLSSERLVRCSFRPQQTATRNFEDQQRDTDERRPALICRATQAPTRPRVDIRPIPHDSSRLARGQYSFWIYRKEPRRKAQEFPSCSSSCDTYSQNSPIWRCLCRIYASAMEHTSIVEYQN